MSRPDAKTAALKQARIHASNIAALAKARYQNHPHLRNWDALSTSLGVRIPECYTRQNISFDLVRQFADFWVNSVETRMEVTSMDHNPPVVPIAKSEAELTFGSVKLYPEQAGCFLAVRDALWTNRTHRAVMNDGGTGSGKTFLAGALIAEVFKQGHHIDQGIPPMYQKMLANLPYRVLIITRKSIIPQYKAVLERFGLGQYLRDNRIVVTNYNQLSSQFADIFVKEKFNPYTGASELEFISGFKPYLVIYDECQGLRNRDTQQTRFVLAMNAIEDPPLQVFMSATPWVTVNDCRTFVIAAKHEYMGARISASNFDTFAGAHAARPDKPNKEAAKRLRKTLAPYIFSFPKIKWPHKAINQVLITEFETDTDRELYNKAYTVFLERKAKTGQNTAFGRFDEFVAIGQFRKTAEPLRVGTLIKESIAQLANGKSVIIGCAYRETVARYVHRMIYQHGFKRSDISIIWGGKRAWKQDQLLDQSALQTLFDRMASGDELDDDERKALIETTNYITERLMSGETDAEQAKRLAEMTELGLTGTQDPYTRQQEIDNFQSGRSRICIFTLAAGGVGLSLDHDRPTTLPRVGYFTPVYSGPEAQQALGRAVRRGTLSDTEQYLVYMAGTIEEQVAAAMDTKLACIAEMTGNFFNLLELDTAKVHLGSTFRTKDQVLADSELDTAQFQAVDEDDEPKAEDPTDE
jgi:hypothetical protein